MAEIETKFAGDMSRLQTRIPMYERMQPEFYQQEVEKVFRRAWLVAACTTDIPIPGSFVLTEIPPLRLSILIVHSNDGKIRAFHNVCRHRGDKLVHTPNGCAKAFTCAFHAWTYATDGRLLNITDASQFDNVEKSQYGLVPVHCETWEDVVFINLDREPRETLREFLGDMYDQYQGFAKNRVKIADHRLVLKTNWNLATNAFSEGYHNLYIHKNTVPDYQGGPNNPDRHRAYLEVGRHFGRYSTHGNQNHKKTPTEEVVFRYSKPMFPWFPKFDFSTQPPGINPSRFDEWGFDIVHIFPNCVFAPQANTHSYMTFWPIDHGHTEIRNWRFAYESDNPVDAIAQAYSVTRAREVIREDMNTMETNLVGILSGAIPHTVLSKQERVIQNHYRAIDDMLAED
ncbi:aromatic ring-hydroxylating dioxygenase subunit alpha [Bordetella sp. BOR01]|uniref:aromatic ring-hydroxylating oxygenase subunit alpha n=1 Tax=Bordetella sp. BOR01 TaxID=2854779 RepID=UPI001C45F891|nr:aromatic ring-hydroxylating dioxygenase subunit alpha [Bordetella sp. BOR01]MBV7483848.1 aromatic ring-hydroxylating dioxygenase subunit alpha [Bordetella sp. BOR01]